MEKLKNFQKNNIWQLGPIKKCLRNVLIAQQMFSKKFNQSNLSKIKKTFENLS
jgi:hypothetical protein